MSTDMFEKTCQSQKSDLFLTQHNYQQLCHFFGQKKLLDIFSFHWQTMKMSEIIEKIGL